jgi:phosphatidylglycerophosphate synthase
MLEVIITFLVPLLLKPHERVYGWINDTFSNLLERKGIPTWLTANFISYCRTTLILPTIILLSNNLCIIPALLTIANMFFDIIDGIVARYWLRKKDEDEICFVLDTDSNRVKRRKRDFGAYVDAVLDKLFVVPLWIFCIGHFQGSLVVWFVLWPLIFTETASGFVRTVAYHTAVGKQAEGGLVTDSSSIQSSHLGKTKQTLEMFGSAFLLLPFTHYFGVVLLLVAWPLAFESVKRKMERRVIYVTCDESPLNELNIEFFQRARSLGSKLVVGIESKSKDGTGYEERRRQVLLLSSVDACIDVAPPLSSITLAWMMESGVDKLCVKKNESLSLKATMLKSNDVFTL